MTLSLQEALTRNDLSIDEYNSLLPQSIDAVLAMDGANIGATIGSWVIIEDEEGHRGFESEYPGIFGLSKLCRILRLEPGLIAISIKTASEMEFEGVAYYRHATEQSVEAAQADEHAETGEVIAEDDAPAENELKGMVGRMMQMNLMMVGWLLNTDLINFLSGEPVLTHEEVNAAILADLTTAGSGNADSTQKPKRKKKRPASAE